MKCLATTTKAFLTVALLQCFAPLAHAAQEGAGADEADGVLRDLRGLPTELRDMCLSYLFYRHQAVDAGLGLCHLEMFASQMRWDRFETQDASPHIRFSEENKAMKGDYMYSTAQAVGWISTSSGCASGTATLLNFLTTSRQDSWWGSFGVILREQRDMNDPVMDSGTSWTYHGQGMIIFAIDGSVGSQQGCLAKINAGDSVTVTVEDGKLSFAVNGVAQGTPIDLPADTEVAMAVSAGGDSPSEAGKVRLS